MEFLAIDAGRHRQEKKWSPFNQAVYPIRCIHICISIINVSCFTIGCPLTVSLFCCSLDVVRRFKRRPERPDACNLYKHWEMGTGDLKTGNWEPGTTAEHAYNNKIYSAPCIKRHAAHSRNTCCISSTRPSNVCRGDQKEGISLHSGSTF